MTNKEYVLTLFPKARVRKYVMGYYLAKLDDSDIWYGPWYFEALRTEEQAWEYLKKRVDKKIIDKLES